MGKYRFVRNGTDDYSLIYGDKKIDFHSDVGIITELQMVYSNAEEQMIFALAEKGKTINDLVKSYKKDGKTYYDYSSKDALKKVYVDKEQTRLLGEAVKKVMGVDYNFLIQDIDFDNLAEAEEFLKDLGAAITGRFRDKGQEKVDQ